MKCLDYLLRFSRLKPLDFCYFKQSPARKEESRELYRVCVPCLAVDEALVDPEDEWMKLPHGMEFNDYLDWGQTKIGEHSNPLKYHRPKSRAVSVNDSGTVDIAESIKMQSGFEVRDSMQQVYLKLDALF